MTTAASERHVHHFACNLTWTGAAHGATASYQSYSREWAAEFAGKPTLKGSAAGAFRGDPALHNPEDLLVAALASCHCLSYLALCARAKIHVVRYEDAAIGTMKAQEGKIRFTEVVLRPRVVIAAGGDRERALALHETAHQECFIANSVNFPVRHEAEVRVEG